MGPADVRLDLPQEEAEEQILPIFAVTQRRSGRGREPRRVLGGCQDVGPSISRERFGDSQAFDSGKIGGDAATGRRLGGRTARR